LIDDPSKPEEALSDARRSATNDWFLNTLYSRLNDKRHGAIVIIMQRLHEDDLVGHALGQEPWEVLSFPAIVRTSRPGSLDCARNVMKLLSVCGAKPNSLSSWFGCGG